MTATMSQPFTETGLHLVSLTIDNFMRIAALNVTADGKHVLITGPNGSGKTSAVEAIWTALKGFSAKDTPEPIHAGAKSGEVTLDLGELIVTRRFTPKGSTLTLTSADGSEIKRPQELLDRLLGEYSLDPVAFLSRRPQDQVDDVLAICGVKPPVKAVQEITGEHHEPKAGESADQYMARLSADDTGLFYLRRRDQGRIVVSKQGAASEAAQELEKAGGPITDKDQVASGSELIAQMEELNKQADQRAELQRAVDRQGARLQEATQAKNQCADRYMQAGNKCLAIEEQIKSLEKQLDDARQQHRVAKAQLASANDDLEQVNADGASAFQAFKAFPDPAPKIQIVRERLANVEKTNASIAARKSAQSFSEKMTADHEASVADHQAIEQKLEALRELRRHLLNGVDLGIDGLSIGDGELKLHGHSFRQASQAESIRVACAIAMRQRPALRLLRVDEGERLDKESRAMLLAHASEHGFQCILTQVSDTDGLAVVIEDGQ